MHSLPPHLSNSPEQVAFSRVRMPFSPNRIHQKRKNAEAGMLDGKQVQVDNAVSFCSDSLASKLIHFHSPGEKPEVFVMSHLSKIITVFIFKVKLDPGFR